MIRTFCSLGLAQKKRTSRQTVKSRKVAFITARLNPHTQLRRPRFSRPRSASPGDHLCRLIASPGAAGALEGAAARRLAAGPCSRASHGASSLSRRRAAAAPGPTAEGLAARPQSPLSGIAAAAAAAAGRRGNTADSSAPETLHARRYRLCSWTMPHAEKRCSFAASPPRRNTPIPPCRVTMGRPLQIAATPPVAAPRCAAPRSPYRTGKGRAFRTKPSGASPGAQGSYPVMTLCQRRRQGPADSSVSMAQAGAELPTPT